MGRNSPKTSSWDQPLQQWNEDGLERRSRAAVVWTLVSDGSAKGVILLSEGGSGLYFPEAAMG